MLSLNDILFGIVLPGVVALAVLAVGWWRPRREARPRGAWAAPIAFAAAFCIAFVRVNAGMPTWPPGEAIHRLFFAAPVLAIALLLIDLRKIPSLVRGAIAVALAAVAFRYVLNFKWKMLPTMETWLWIGLGVAVTAVWAASFAAHARRTSRATSPIALLLLTGATSLVFMMSDTQSYGLMEMGLVAAAVAALVVAFFAPRFSLADGRFFVASLLTLLLVALSVNAHATAGAGIEPINAAVLVASPIVLWLTSLIRFGKLRLWTRELVVILMMCVPLSIAVVRATIKFQETYKPKDSADFYEM
jgi:hypothetical protein